MKYMGSKNRIAKFILPVMTKQRKPNQWWVEPFVGGANVIDKVEGLRIGADINSYLIKALKLVRDNPNLIPRNNKEYTEEMFNAAKLSDLSDPVDCFAMFQYTFGSKFKDSWARNKKGTDYVKECVKNVLTQSQNIKGVDFIDCSFKELVVPNRSIIYCDPPYQNTTSYKGLGSFNHDEFWQWAREKKIEGHSVFISEYVAPSDFVCIWEQDVRNNMLDNTKKNKERLFTI